jgi:hypothetical protein
VFCLSKKSAVSVVHLNWKRQYFWGKWRFKEKLRYIHWQTWHDNYCHEKYPHWKLTLPNILASFDYDINFQER